ncbi:hypothetical protein QBZ16_002443 [Prototheca wickerhamii]|uniref:t-SNARE coiled-coil homology domain-containing protein n=1 Tax=Prototheca wickerhamii TaxID=3111 RepID=A0AAD9INW8_PROWI|nr:hypothetical protein QBZ16_002443 [Prototheca wickerhamii]
MTATARRSLGALGTKLDALRASIESESGLSENEKNRRRDMVSALRSRRESLLAGLKREGGGASAQRAVLLGSVDASSARPRETASWSTLERGVASTKQVALRINEETTLQNRLLEDLDDAVATTTSRMGAAQRRLRRVMAAGGWSCQKQLLIILMLVLLVVLVVAILRVVTK